LSALGIGVGPSDFPNTEFAGKSRKSVAYTNDGKLYFHDGKKAKVTIFGPKFYSADVIGCGVTNQGHSYYTLNGVLVGVCRAYPLSGVVHAIISVSGLDTSLPINSGTDSVFQHKCYEKYMDSKQVPTCTFDISKTALSTSAKDKVRFLVSNTKDSKLLDSIRNRIEPYFREEQSVLHSSRTKTKARKKSRKKIGNSSPKISSQAENKLTEALSPTPSTSLSPSLIGKLPHTWTTEDVLLWFKSLSLNQDYNEIITSEKIDGDVLFNDLCKNDEWLSFGFVLEEDIEKIKQAKDSFFKTGNVGGKSSKASIY